MKPFKFKQFTIHQDRCAMKVGTDGVLLGAWASLEHQPNSILDIGAGTGLITLMLAQRSTAETIEALELDDQAFEQCVENFEVSPWSDRLFCYHASFQEFALEMDEPYDLIVSNPPFYSEANSSGDRARDNARQNQSLPFETLIKGVSKLLSGNGEFSVVVPYSEEQKFIGLANSSGLFPNKQLHVKGNPSASIKRSLLQFSREKTFVQTNELVIELDRHAYTQDYVNLTKDFYLKM